MIQRNLLIKKTALIGAGIGLAMFAVFGLLHGALIGGTAGLGIANYVFGESTLALMANELLPRIVVGASMLVGVMVAAIAFVVSGSVIGAAGGYALSLLTGVEEVSGEAVPAPEHANQGSK